MFTLKLYTDARPHAGTTRIIAAERFVVYRYENGSAQISAWQKDGDGEPFYVGLPDHQIGPDFVMYDHAVIENSAGRTTEVVRQIPGDPMLNAG